MSISYTFDKKFLNIFETMYTRSSYVLEKSFVINVHKRIESLDMNLISRGKYSKSNFFTMLHLLLNIGINIVNIYDIFYKLGNVKVLKY